MARIEGTGEKPKQPLRARLPRFAFEGRGVVAYFVLAPVVLMAPTDFLRAVALAVVLPAAFLYGLREGRADHAREVIRELRANDR